MPIPKHTPSVPAQAGLWCYERRDRALTRAVLAGVSCALLAQLHDLSLLRVQLIVRKTCARVRPDWTDEAGSPAAWSVPLSTLRDQRASFPL